MYGRIEVITGPMFSGKTSELIRKLQRAQVSKQTVAAFKPLKDTRHTDVTIKSHSGLTIPCYSIGSIEEIEELLLIHDCDAIGIDELQFFDHKIQQVLPYLRDSLGVHIIVSFLNTTFRAEPWPYIPYVMALADNITFLTAVCHTCGKDASLTQRLIDGKPASFNEETIVVGGLDSYEARCRECFEPG